MKNAWGFVVFLSVATAGFALWAGEPPAQSGADSKGVVKGVSKPKARANAAGPRGQYLLSPEESEKLVRVAPGFEAGLFAAEPHLASPVSMTFDADGDVYVAEMLDYPLIRTPGMFGPFPEGQIRLLRTDASGKVVKSVVFATALSLPTSVVPYDGGILVAAAPDILFFKDEDGDGRADVREVVLTGFDTEQDLYRVNSLLWGVDGWVYARGVGNTPIHWGDEPEGPALSTDNMDFRFRPKEKKFEAVSGMSSCFGLTMDDWGHRFFSNSANHVYQVVLPNNYLRRNPFLAATGLTREISDHGGVAKVFRVSEPQAWRVERSEAWEKAGLNKKYFGTIEPRQDYMTAVCGPLVYRESAFPPEFRGNYFVCEAVGNLVHRDVLGGDRPAYVAGRGYPDREFFASADPWCSPVGLTAGPDGAIYVVDMFRQVIEHAGPDGGRDVPNIPLEILRKYGLRAGSAMGRVFRVAPAGMARPPKPQLGKAGPNELVEALGRADAWWRTTAQRLILEHPESADLKGIEAIARTSPHAAARLQALWTLDALGKLDGGLVVDALRDPEPGVRENALRLAETRFATTPSLAPAVLKMVDDPHARVRFQLAFTLGELKPAERLKALEAIVRRDSADPYARAAVLSSIGDDGLALYERLGAGASFPGLEPFLFELSSVIGARLDKAEIAGLLKLAERPSAEIGARGTLATLRGLAQGLNRRGKKGLEAPAALAPLKRLMASRDESTREAAAGVGSFVRTRSDAERREAVRVAAAVALDDARELKERVEAARELGSGDFEAVAPTLTQLLHPRHPEAIQHAALSALDDQAGPGVVPLIIESWRGLTPAVRPAAIEVALGRKERLTSLLEAIRKGTIPPESIDSQQRARLLATTDPRIVEAARVVFGPSSSQGDPKLFEKYKEALELKGDAGRGGVAFKKLCITCHKAGKEGTEVGPNLASVKNHPREQILKDILYPSRTVQPSHVQYVVETTGGQIFTGLIAASNATSLTLKRAGTEDVTLLRKDIETLGNTQVSVMPEKLLDGLKPQDVADLLEFVKGIE